MAKTKQEQAQSDKRTKKTLESEIGRMRIDAERKQAEIDKKEVKVAAHESDILRLRGEVESLLEAADAIESDLLSKYSDDEPMEALPDVPEPV